MCFFVAIFAGYAFSLILIMIILSSFFQFAQPLTYLRFLARQFFA